MSRICIQCKKEIKAGYHCINVYEGKSMTIVFFHHECLEKENTDG